MNATASLAEEYVRLGLALGQHEEGLVDCYYGPPQLQERANAEGRVDPRALVQRARRLLAELGSDGALEPGRRRWIADQTRGLLVTARRLAGERIAYLDEIEACYGVRPTYVPEDSFAGAHRRLDAALPGSGPLRDRYVTWRESQVVPPRVVGNAVRSLAEDFRERTDRLFGLPDGERIEFELVTSKPWSGFNYYLGELTSRVAINLDLPVLSPSLGRHVAHEAYPGHHTEHCRKEVTLSRRSYLEETVFLVGTPQCLVAEGLADLGLEVIAGRRPEGVVAEHLVPLGVPFDAAVAAEVADPAEDLGAVTGNAAIMMHDRGTGVDEAVDYVERWALVSRPRARKSVEFLTAPTWRAYPFCYIDGLRLCRSFVGSDPRRFQRLITEQVVPAELAAQSATP